MNIAFASPPIRSGGVIEKRLEGYRRALKEFQIDYNPDFVFSQEISVQEGKALGRRLAQRKEITGIFASADVLAAVLLDVADRDSL